MKNLLHEAIKNRKTKALCRTFFGTKPTLTQEKIIQSIAFREHKRIIINCMTRYGKTYSMADAVCLYILLNENKRILLIAPGYDQAKILRNYISDRISACPIFNDLIETGATEAERLKKEFSKRRLTFKNGCELMVLSAEGSGDRLMGFGGDLIIMDESCLISHEVYRSKISRMLGDNPDSMLVEIGNPWDRENHFFEHWNNPEFFKIHVDYHVALEEGRATSEFIESQRSELTPMEFTVLYESKFPDSSEDSIFSYSRVKQAINRFKDLKRSEFVIGCDVADKGRDRTVIIVARRIQDYYMIHEVYSEAKSENTAVAGRILALQKQYTAMEVNIDCIGVGVGVVSMVKQGLDNRHVKVNACHYGHKSSSDRFMNRKAEMYFRLQKLFNSGQISIPEDKSLVKDLLSVKWEYSSGGKIKVIDPEKSPDFSDALVYCTWRVAAPKLFIK